MKPKQQKIDFEQDEGHLLQGHIRLFSFVVGSQTFALDVSDVWEIRKGGTITPVPGEPSLLGLTHLRGEIVPVFDGCLLFEEKVVHTLERATEKRSEHMLVLDIPFDGSSKNRLIGIHVNQVNEVFDISRSKIVPSVERGSSPAICGLIERGNDKSMIIVLDAKQIWRQAVGACPQSSESKLTAS